MEIVPIAAVRAVSLQHQPKAGGIEEPHFEIEASARADDDTYSHDEQAEGDDPKDRSAEAAEDAEDVASTPTESTTPALEGNTISILA